MRTFCINLDIRPDRWEATQKEMLKLDVVAERFSAIKKDPGWEGCRDSYLELFRNVQYLDQFMVIEDDIEVCLNGKEIIDAAIKQLPAKWDMLYLGATLNTPLERVTSNLFRLRRGYTTHAIIYNDQHNIVDFILKNKKEIRKIDVFFADEVQERFNCYITYPMAVTQRIDFSDIMGYETSNVYRIIQERYNKYTQ